MKARQALTRRHKYHLASKVRRGIFNARNDHSAYYEGETDTDETAKVLHENWTFALSSPGVSPLGIGFTVQDGSQPAQKSRHCVKLLSSVCVDGCPFRDTL